MKKGLSGLGLIVAGAALTWWWYPSPAVDFNTQVKPIINRNCIVCHGGVRRKSGFSLLFRQDALEPCESGKRAIIPGNPGESEMIRRVTADDPEDRMPFKHDPLPRKEIDILREWIRQGAPWGDHWAYVPVKEVRVPTEGSAWAKNDIDHFVATKWKEHGLTHSPEADKRTLLRRVSLDLTGLPPSTEMTSHFLGDSSAGAYDHLVDQLLQSPQFGERWTSCWLDLARYADTKGYERDYNRSIWRYRDWLIRAFNADKPYDEFLTEQIAGDLLPDPTNDQLIATAFHRNTMTNDEGGTQNEEFRTAAVLDRVNTTWEALLGTTFACTQCHSHPYDPFRHEEYYQFAAFFNNTRDEDTEGDYPVLRTFNNKDSSSMERLLVWMRSVTSPERTAEVKQFLRTWQPSINSLVADKFVNSELADSKWLVLRQRGTARIAAVDLTGKDHLIFRFASWSAGGRCQLRLDSADGPVVGRIAPRDTKGTWTIGESDIHLASGIHDVYFTYENSLLRKPGDNGIMFDWLYFTTEFPGRGTRGYDSARASFWNLATTITGTTPVMTENPASMKRKSFVFDRGNWLVKGKEVTTGTPRSLPPFPADAPANRLGLAQWITSTNNPLTARTMVNRLWEQLFGNGLAETLEDLGTQGIPPTHPGLLDYLSWQFMHEFRWSIKSLLREMVLSATYRQASRMRPEDLVEDPGNRYFARGARVRLTAEEIRDQALAVSGLLSAKMYGPGVMPYQPKGIWNSPYNGLSWKLSEGEDRYRRGLYTFWKRTSAYPSMLLFDGVAREVCSARRIRTNTPLQALTLLNDSVYVEASRHFADDVRKHCPGDVRRQITSVYERAIGRPITPERLDILSGLYAKSGGTVFHKAKNAGDRDIALEQVVTAVMNFDEFLTKN